MQESALHIALADWSSALPHPRLAIYRNNVSAALVNALKVRYPVTAQLVGDEFFFAMARDFANANRPRSAVLIEYGEGFPSFVQGFAPAACVPYLADVAALESLWWRAYHAAEADAMKPEAIAQLGHDEWAGLRFRFHPSVGLMRSPHAAASIWLAHHGGAAMNTIRTGAPECILVSRPDADVVLRIIPPASHGFLEALLAGERLADAVEMAAGHYPGFDPGAQIGALLTLQLLTGHDS
jgi:hypothetical protein